MTELRKINESFAVGLGHPDKKDLAELAMDGFRAVVNLRHPDEDGQPLQPGDEGEEVRSLGMDYIHIPVSGEALDESVVDRFRDSVEDLPEPIYVHCASGKRSGAFTMMHVASKGNMSGDDALRRAEAMGFECDSADLEKFVKNYVDNHNS
jgi:uncharacterized protein (TIGR01244 family)